MRAARMGFQTCNRAIDLSNTGHMCFMCADYVARCGLDTDTWTHGYADGRITYMRIYGHKDTTEQPMPKSVPKVGTLAKFNFYF